MANQSVVDRVKKNVKAGTYRMASKKIIKGSKSGILTLLRMVGAQNNMAPDKLESGLAMFEAVLDTEIGSSLIAAVLGVTLDYVPQLKDNTHAQILIDELQQEGVAIAEEVVFDAIVAQLKPDLLPIVQGKAAPKRIKEHKENKKIKVKPVQPELEIVHLENEKVNVA